MKYFEASAKDNIGVETLFEGLMTEIYNKRQKIQLNPTIALN